MKLATTLAVLAAALLATPAWSHGDAHGDMHRDAAAVVKEQKPWGIAGDAKGARTIHVGMSDRMRFDPERITVREGETVRIALRNGGQMLHEMVIGTPEELREHAALMQRFPNMQHDEPFMSHVQPGRGGEIVWTFNRPGTFAFACLIPGHSEAGMTGTIVVTPRKGGKE